MEEVQAEANVSADEIAAALAYMAHSSHPLFVAKDKLLDEPLSTRGDRGGRDRDRGDKRGGGRKERSNQPMDYYRVEVGRKDGVKPGDLVGAIANEANMRSSNIGNITINDSHSFVQLPVGLGDDTQKLLSKVWVRNKPLKLQKTDLDYAPQEKRRRPEGGDKRRRDNSNRRFDDNRGNRRNGNR